MVKEMIKCLWKTVFDDDEDLEAGFGKREGVLEILNGEDG